eukprot:jgi/Pico_ML_1/53602/g4124.t1
MDKLLNELQEIERLAQELEDLKRDMVECHTLREAAREAGEAVQKLQEASQTTAAGEKDKDKQKALLLDLRQKESTSEHVGSNL